MTLKLASQHCLNCGFYGEAAMCANRKSDVYGERCHMNDWCSQWGQKQ
jgi:hypothetical protein